MKNIKYYIIALIVGVSFSACEDYLTVLPENNQSSSEYWETKEEVEAVLGAGYVKLRNSIESMFLWGEARGNGLKFDNTNGSDLQKAARKVRDMDILTDNKLSEWSNIYKVIAMANSVIKYAPAVVERDASFNENMMKSFCSEAYFLRSLAYFYLVRTFKDVPFVKEPYVDDSAPYSLAKSDGDEILTTCVAELGAALTYAKEFFPESDNTNQINTKGRATKWALHALLADINLWMGNYDECLKHCDAVLNSQKVGLISGEYWFSNYYPGNSNESIFEIQYSYVLNQTNSFIKWFSSDSYYKITDYTRIIFAENENDVRGDKASFDSEDKLWKYIGKNQIDARSASNENDQNYIIYRVADIYLMKAEAYIMKNNPEYAIEQINAVRSRAGILPVDASSNQIQMLTMLLKERQREFLAEGKAWFDLLRIGRYSDMEGGHDGYRELMIEQVVEGVSASSIPLVRSTLKDNGSWYLPINQSELNGNPLLVQSDYYLNIGN